MILSGERTETVFRKVKQIQEELAAYVLASDRPDLSIEDFQYVIENMYGIKIEKYAVPFEANFLRGMMERYEKRAIIYVRKDMSYELIRFTAVKEMCHIAIDQEEDWSSSGHETIRDLVSEYSIQNDKEAEITSQSEMLAEIAATELLYPFDHRQIDRKKVENGETTIGKIANHYKIPQFIVSRGLGDNHHEIAEFMWEIVNNQ